MKSMLLGLILAVTLLPATTQAQDILDYYRDFQQQQQQQYAVEQHPKATEPIDTETLGGPLPPYLAQKYLRNEQYMNWALMWNAYQDEKANRATKTRLLFGQTTTTTNTTNGTVTNTVPRVWFQHQGAPGQIRYNPFVVPKR